jgi:hypothetical protein
MHEDLEKILNDEGDFSTIPSHLDHLIHELHYCLHRMQFKDKPSRTGYFQVEWFNNDYIPLPNDFSFTTNLSFGDIILQNPFVGHNPIRVYKDNDFDDIDRTCRLPTRIKSGIVIYTIKGSMNYDFDHYKNWWLTHGKSIVDAVGFNEILKFTGEGKIGEVVNKDLLLSIINDENVLEFEKLEFIEN